jgi:hypothetical protein
MEQPAPLLDWVKRLGQHHYVEWAESTCLCGQPCLGNNYSRTIPRERWIDCPGCMRVAKEKGLITDA